MLEKKILQGSTGLWGGDGGSVPHSPHGVPVPSPSDETTVQLQPCSYQQWEDCLSIIYLSCLSDTYMCMYVYIYFSEQERRRLLCSHLERGRQVLDRMLAAL